MENNNLIDHNLINSTLHVLDCCAQLVDDHSENNVEGKNKLLDALNYFDKICDDHIIFCSKKALEISSSCINQIESLKSELDVAKNEDN